MDDGCAPLPYSSPTYILHPLPEPPRQCKINEKNKISYSWVKGMTAYSGESPITLFVHSFVRESPLPTSPAAMIFCKQALLKL